MGSASPKIGSLRLTCGLCSSTVFLAPAKKAPGRVYDETVDWTSEGVVKQRRAVLAWASDVYFGESAHATVLHNA